MNWAKFIKSRSIIAVAAAKRITLTPFVRNRGPGPWLGRLAEEDLAATPPELWDTAEPSSRCLACGMCDGLGEPGAPPLSHAILGPARRPEDAHLAAEIPDRLRARATEIARICPARLGVEEIATLIEGNARMLSAVRGES